MFMKKCMSAVLSAALLAASIPVNAQPIPKEFNFNYTSPATSFGQFNAVSPFGTFKPAEEIQAEFDAQQKEHQKELDSRLIFAITNPNAAYDGLSYLDALYVWQKLHPEIRNNYNLFVKEAFIDPSWYNYKNAIKDLNTSKYRSYSPYQVMKAMEAETKTIGELLKKNPRYIREVNKAKAKEYGKACLDGIVIGLLLVASVYTCGAAGCAGGAAWFGGTAATATLAGTASVGLTKTIAAVVLLEIASTLTLEILDNLYEDLTNRLIKYNAIANNQYAQQLINAAAKGSIANECTVQCAIPNQPKVTPGTRWLDDIAQEEALIRLHGLIVIKNELQYNPDPTKYDLALLDIINLFSDVQEVEFDEKVFTRKKISEGEIHYQKNSNKVDVGLGRLMQRTPELTKALKAIQNMDGKKPSAPTRTYHPREGANGMIWPNK